MTLPSVIRPHVEQLRCMIVSVVYSTEGTAMNSGEFHWHQYTWEVDQSAPADWSTSIGRRPRITPGQVSRIPTPGDDARIWHEHGAGGYVTGKGSIVSANIVWRCRGECPK